MNRKLISVGVIMAALFVYVLLNKCGCNEMSNADRAVRAAWTEVENGLQQRANTIPELVAIAKKHISYEKKILSEIAESRARMEQLKIDVSMLDNVQAVINFQANQNAVSDALLRLRSAALHNSDLMSDKRFLGAMHLLIEAEEHIDVAAVQYNTAVRAFNDSLREFPNNLANVTFMHLKPRALFSLHEKKPMYSSYAYARFSEYDKQ